MDLMMPGVDGVEGTELCLAASPDSKVVVLTSKAEDDLVLPAIKAGALSYLLKDVSADELAGAVRDAAAGKATFHPVASARMARAVSGEHKGQDLAGRISPRELEVLNLIAEGYGNREIGERLFISKRTVKSHVTHLLEKLDLRDRTQLAIYALRNNLAVDQQTDFSVKGKVLPTHFLFFYYFFIVASQDFKAGSLFFGFFKGFNYNSVFD